MIINVRACSNRLGIIVAYLVENEKKTGYASFITKKFLVKDKIEMLTAIKKTLTSSREVPEINANDFVSTINKICRNNVFDTSLKALVKAVNDENMQPTMATLSHTCFNDKPLPQVKAINIINGNMYFMIKMGASYNLEIIETGKIECIMVVSSLVNLYRRIKHGGTLPKGSFKKHYISKTRRDDSMRDVYRSFGVDGFTITNDNTPAEPILEESPVSAPEIPREAVPPSTSSNNWYGPTLYTYSNGTSTRSSERQVIGPEDLVNMEENVPTPGRQQTTIRQRTEQRESIVEAIRAAEENGPTVIDTAEREAEEEAERRDRSDTNETDRSTERQAVINRNRLIRIEPLSPESLDQDEDEEEEDSPDLSTRRISSEIDEDLSRLHEESPVIRNLPITETEEEIPTIGINVAERQSFSEAERRSLSGAERQFEDLITRSPEANEAVEEDLATRRPVSTTSHARRAMITERSRQTEEERRMSTEERNSFVDYLRDNQAVTLSAL